MKYISKVENGSTPKSDNVSFFGGNIRWFTPTDFKNANSGGYLEKPNRYISELGIKNSGCTFVEKKSVLLTTRAPVGNISIIDSGFTFNQGCKSLSPSSEISIRHLYWYLGTVSEQLNLISNGTTFKELSTDSLLNFPVPVPSLDEQKLISLNTLIKRPSGSTP